VLLSLALVLAAVLTALPGMALAADTTPPVIGAVQATGVTATGATITWTTDEPADGRLEWGTTTGYSSASPSAPALSTTHAFTLSGIPGRTTSTTYHYRVNSRDGDGNLATSADFTFTTPADTAAPVISGVQASAAADGVWISWTTDENADRQIEYGTTTAYGAATALDPAARTVALTHAVQLPPLAAGTLYHYRVLSRDRADNLAVSADGTFTASADTTAPTIQSNGALASSTTDVSVTWLTSEMADAQVEYGATAAYGATTALDTVAAFNHGRTISGLQAATTYHYRILTRDRSGNLATSADATVTTKTGTAAASPTAPASPTATAIPTATPTATATAPAGPSGASGGCASCSIWPSPVAPQGVAGVDGQAVELGVRFRAQTDGYVAGVRYYTGQVNAAALRGSLWSAAGTSLATGTTGVVDPRDPNWTLVRFAAPVPVAAGTSYVASYYASTGGYPYTGGYFASTGTTTGPLTALASGVDGPNGLYRYAAGGGFPIHSYNATNYWVDVLFQDTDTVAPPDTTAPVITGVHADVTATGATISWTTDEPADSRVENGTSTAYASAPGVDATLTTTHSYTLGITPSTTATTVHFRVLSRDAAGNLAASDDFTYTTLPDTSAPVIAGLTATDTANGAQITWTTDENADQQVEYGPTAAYGATTVLEQTGAKTHTVLMSGLQPGALYHYRALSRDKAGNLAVSADGTFTAPGDATAPVITFGSVNGVTTTSVSIGWSTDEPSDAQVEYGTTAAYGASSPLNSSLQRSHVVALTGLQPGVSGTLYHYRVKSRDAAGNLATTADATFTTFPDPTAQATPAPSACPCSIWSDSTVPAVTTLFGGGSVELGLKFRADTDGQVTGVRFYKGIYNTGTHIGHLWSASGTLLASVTFAGETATGWQTASFASPVPIVAGTTYIVSYAAPDGGYAYNGAYFAAQGTTNGPLLAPGGSEANGVYAYGTNGFPASSYNATNYWVDVVFTAP
jgi:hypothetical protein